MEIRQFTTEVVPKKMERTKNPAANLYSEYHIKIQSQRDHFQLS